MTKKKQYGNPWPAEHVRELKALWPNPKISASRIAIAISDGQRTYTRNAVIGRAHRLIELGELKPRGNAGTAARLTPAPIGAAAR